MDDGLAAWQRQVSRRGMEVVMSERINVGSTAFATGNAIQAGVASAVASLQYDRAIASQRDALARIAAVNERARVRTAQRRVRAMLGL